MSLLLWLLVAPGVLWTGEWGLSRRSGPGCRAGFRAGDVGRAEELRPSRGLGQRDGHLRSFSL